MCSIDWNIISNWITAGATLALAVFTLLTLIKLRSYADDTKRMADTASDQLKRADDDREATIRPFIAVGWSTDPAKLPSEKLYIRNLGSGVAINVSWKRCSGMTESTIIHMVYIENRPEKQELFAADGNNVRVFQDRTLTISYESLSGRRYESEVKIGHMVPGNLPAELTLNFREVGR
jgi:hypothetical protein